MTEQSNVVTINGTDYTADQLSDNQRYMIEQIKDLQNKANGAKFQLDQLNVAKDAFTNALIASVENPETEQDVAVNE